MNKPDAGPQPIVTLLDRLLPPDEEDAPDPDWDELTARVARLAPANCGKFFFAFITLIALGSVGFVVWAIVRHGTR